MLQPLELFVDSRLSIVDTSDARRCARVATGSIPAPAVLGLAAATTIRATCCPPRPFAVFLAKHSTQRKRRLVSAERTKEKRAMPA